MTIKVIKRPAIVEETPELDREYRAARWVYNRLLDFEFEHQRRLDEVSPRLSRVGRLIARLNRRDRWRERASSGTWAPRERAELRAALIELRDQLRKDRNANPRWKEVLNWPREKAGEKKCRRKRGESDEDFEVRKAKAFRSRREMHVLEVYADSRCNWATFNAQKASVDQALKMVLKVRKAGMPAQLRRPKRQDPGRITAARNGQQIGFEVLDQDKHPWWTMRLRLKSGWVRFRAKVGNFDEVPDDATIKVVELCRRREGQIWKYHVCITVEGSWPECERQPNHVVGIDTGHRFFPDGSIRAWVWYGSDGARGEVVLPPKCQELLEKAQTIQTELDKRFNSFGTRHRSRHAYRAHLLRSGVRSEEEQAWLTWETRREIDIKAKKRRAREIRTKLYEAVLRQLRHRYRACGIDVNGRSVQRLQKEEQQSHKSRRNRDLTAAYELKTLCERYGIGDSGATARKSTMECPGCGQERETSKDLIIWCPTCDLSCDQDFGAAYVMMCRTVEVLANRQEDSRKDEDSNG